MAFGSRLAGPQQVFVVPFPGPGSPKQLSSSSGMNPMWRKDGKAIVYLTADFSSVMETEVEAKGNDFVIGKTRLLFKTAAETGAYQFSPIDVAGDGKKIIINTPPEVNGQEITVIANWQAGLKN